MAWRPMVTAYRPLLYIYKHGQGWMWFSHCCPVSPAMERSDFLPCPAGSNRGETGNAMPSCMWRHGMHSFLELLRHRWLEWGKTGHGRGNGAGRKNGRPGTLPGRLSACVPGTWDVVRVLKKASAWVG